MEHISIVSSTFEFESDGISRIKHERRPPLARHKRATGCSRRVSRERRAVHRPTRLTISSLFGIFRVLDFAIGIRFTGDCFFGGCVSWMIEGFVFDGTAIDRASLIHVWLIFYLFRNNLNLWFLKFSMVY